VKSNEESEGILVLNISVNVLKYAKDDDVLKWFKSKEIQFPNDIRYDVGDILVDEGKLRFRYKHEFFAGESKVSKTVRIDSRLFTFNNIVDFIKGKVVTYTIDSLEDPQFDEDILGSIFLATNEGKGATVTLEDSDFNVLKYDMTANSLVIDKLKAGNYRITLSKEGY